MAMGLQYDPPSVPDAPRGLAAASARLRFYAAVTLACLFLFLAFYLALAAGAGWLLFRASTYPVGHLSKGTVFLKAIAIASSGMLFLFFQKGLFQRHRGEDDETRIDERQADARHDERFGGFCDGRFLEPGSLEDLDAEVGRGVFSRDRVERVLAAVTGPAVKERLDQVRERRREDAFLLAVEARQAPLRNGRFEFRGAEVRAPALRSAPAGPPPAPEPGQPPLPSLRVVLRSGGSGMMEPGGVREMDEGGPNQDSMHLPESGPGGNAKSRGGSYSGNGPDDEEEVSDLGFIVEDHDDRRAHVAGEWQRIDDLDTDEPLETNRSGEIPHATTLRGEGAPEEWFATDYHVDHARAEEQEEEFVETSMLSPDPDTEEESEDFTDETFTGLHGEPAATNLLGHAAGVIRGAGTSLAMDGGLEAFEIRDNPLMQPEGEPISDEVVSDEALGIRDVDEMGSSQELEALAERAVREAELSGEPL